MRSIVSIFGIIMLLTNLAEARETLSLRERAKLVDDILEERVHTVLPQIMERSGIDLWVVMSREYNEDPVLKTLLPSDWMSARRHTMLVMYNPGNGEPIEALAVSRYGVGSLFEQSWDKELQPNQWAALVEVIESRNPKVIAINKDADFALADGMSASEYERFMGALPEHLRHRVRSSRELAIGWLETRSATEVEVFSELVGLGHELIAEAFSNAVVTPGITTTDDIAWWLREQSAALNLGNWFHPSVSLQRNNGADFDQIESFSNAVAENVIYPGDLLHVDFGITYLRLNTDQQQHAYVLKSGETEAPDYLVDALAQGNRLQDILMDGFEVGVSGNELLASSLARARQEGLNPSIYTHPLGLHGHAAGPTIGMWDSQGGVPIAGDYPIYPNTAYSIELNVAVTLPEWDDQEIRIMLEEDAFFDGDSIEFLSGRQIELHLITSDPN
ncbi:MAG: M24 family metallopeptidase [Gammaproteobacteria bacterium]|nr:M24 family metallopeptidase [Gammaproteobacteria bacterium]